VNGYEFGVLVLILLFVFKIVQHKMGIPVGSRRRMRGEEPGSDQENDRLRSQVKQLQERIHVLERIVTDRGVETAAQIEALRERERIDDGDKLQ